MCEWLDILREHLEHHNALNSNVEIYGASSRLVSRDGINSTAMKKLSINVMLLIVLLLSSIPMSPNASRVESSQQIKSCKLVNTSTSKSASYDIYT